MDQAALIRKLKKYADSRGTAYVEDDAPATIKFHAYQNRWIGDKSQIKVAVKSRRLGWSWADAGDSALEAARSGGCDTFYIGYNKEMAAEYIADVAAFAQYYNHMASEVDESVLEDESDIITYTVYFASGHKVQALSSNPRSIRSKGRPKTRLRIDELAFHDDPEEVLKAAIAFKMWGGNIAIWSTHYGIENPFNKLIERIRSGELNYSLHECTFRQAIAEGLYKTICRVNGEEWTPEKEEAFVASTYSDYGIDADEELDCIPSDLNKIRIFDRSWVKILDRWQVPFCDRKVRFWDLAATEKDLKRKNDPCNTAGVLMGYSSYLDQYVVLDCVAEAFNPADTDDLIKAVAAKDGYEIAIAHELEGGASGIRDAQHIKAMLQGYVVNGVRPEGNKILRGKPFCNDAKNGKVAILKGDWNEEYLAELNMVPLGLMDRFDASAGAKNYLDDFNIIDQYKNYFD